MAKKKKPLCPYCDHPVENNRAFVEEGERIGPAICLMCGRVMVVGVSDDEYILEVFSLADDNWKEKADRFCALQAIKEAG